MFQLLLLAIVLGVPQTTSSREGTARPAPGAPAPTSVITGQTDPDVLVILADDFAWIDLESVEAPHIADLASRGMTFRNGYSFPLCSITRYSLVFGRYPRRDGIGTLVDPEPPGPENPSPTMGLTTLPMVVRLTPRSVSSGAFISKWHLGTNPQYDGDPGPDIGPADIGAMTPLLHGFDRFLAGNMANLGGPGGYNNWQRVDDGVYSTSTEYAPQAQLDAFTSWWVPGGRRLAVFATHLSHGPIHVPPPNWLPKGYPHPTNARQAYEAMVVACDTLVGRILAEVDLEHTYVFLMVDNGTPDLVSITPCGPYATFTGCTKSTVFQGGINVPFMVAGPGVPAGSTTEAVVSTTDVMATVAELLGVHSPGEDSISFAPVLFDPAARTRRIAFSEVFGMFPGPAGEEYHEETAAIGERYKMRRYDGEEFLFDLLNDPGETEALDPEHPPLADVVQELRAVLDDPLDRTLQE